MVESPFFKTMQELYESKVIGRSKRAVVFLQSNLHTMVMVHKGDHVLALDGRNPTHGLLEPLARSAVASLCELGFSMHVRVDAGIEFWTQPDDDEDSCGWHCLNFLRAVIFDGVLDKGSRSFKCPERYPLWHWLTKELNGLLPTIGLRDPIQTVSRADFFRRPNKTDGGLSENNCIPYSKDVKHVQASIPFNSARDHIISVLDIPMFQHSSIQFQPRFKHFRLCLFLHVAFH